ncbi:hypothetical protein [Aminobacter sp. MDW-2]|uniref:hypothetical protein n=1 Tax=Aminobacter sp. MDW-2 TaxID=2666139 RepID=UPI0012B00A2B|nr:hypothetical protein [Aminobacter sp. MDW-2]MRX33196.1 hypothetical protein [Aminobacter sp. MDW-2]QNH36819.1 hypothetical protein H5P29_13490 [Aminobacter sp. MDW-2]
MNVWPGPLFYPPVGKIAVMQSGARIEVWDNDSDSAGCFTGLLLKGGDLSCMWDRTKVDHIEEPTDDDLHLGMLPRAVAS